MSGSVTSLAPTAASMRQQAGLLSHPGSITVSVCAPRGAHPNSGALLASEGRARPGPRLSLAPSPPSSCAHSGPREAPALEPMAQV